MLNDFDIVKEKVATTFIGHDGNLHSHTENEKFFLKNENDEIISHMYYCMIYLGDDHFAVCDIKSDIRFCTDYNYYDIIKGDYEIETPKIKWGIIRVTRDKKGKIIPKGEIMVIPYIYDRISENNLKTATVYNRGNSTYLDLDRERSSYGEQLVPCVLNQTVPFDVSYDGFAECSINGIEGYLPRDCKVKESIEGNELLIEADVLCLSRYFNGSKDCVLDSDTISSYFNLTGKRLVPEKGKQFKKTRNQENKKGDKKS